MKNLRTLILCTSLSVCSILQAQEQKNSIPLNEPNMNRALLFSAVADNVPVKVEAFKSLLKTEEGTTVNIQIATNFSIQGEVVSSVEKYKGAIQSVVVRSINYPGAVFTFTKTILSNDQPVVYTARITSMQHGDLFELVESQGEYKMVKRKFYDLVNE